MRASGWASATEMGLASAGDAIAAVGLRKRFGGVTAVDGLELVVRAGEVFGLVGPDGAGKTTTMRILCGALAADEGTAKVAGFEVGSHPEEVKRRIGYLPQRLALYSDLTVDENILFQARIQGVREPELSARRERLLSFTRLGRFRGRQAQALSGGMRQKLGLACALIHEPTVLLLDEPTTGVDPVSRGEFWELVLGLVARGITVLVTTPYMDEAERCARVGLMYEGKLLAVGRPDEIKRQAALSLLQVSCDPLREGREVARRVPGVRWVEIFGDRLHVAVLSAEVAGALSEGFARGGVQVAGVTPIEPGLEDAFFELVSRGREAEA